MRSKYKVKFRKKERKEKKWKGRSVTTRSLAIVNSRKDAKEDTSLKYVRVFQNAKIRINVQKDILEIAKDFLLKMVADTKKNVPITTMFLIKLRRAMR